MDNQRLDIVLGLIKNSKFDALVLNPGATLTYLTKLDFHLMERPVLLFLVPETNPVIVVPALEKQKITNSLYAIEISTYSDDPATWLSTIQATAKKLNLEGKRIGVEPSGLRFFEFDLIQKAIPHVSFFSAAELIGSLRRVKSGHEIQAHQRAVDIAQRALLKTLPLICSGVSEKFISNQLVIHLLQFGSQPHLPFMPIVSAGPHSADPHAIPSDTLLKPGDILVIDWGARFDGYISDLTRTFAIEYLDDKFKTIAQSVINANQAACSAIGPGVNAGAIDQIARNCINNDGYAQYFTHRTGHGIGLDAHEEPYIYSENKLILEAGMTFTIEPGIYLPGIGGVRIEDNVVVTGTGASVLSDLPREIQVVG